MSENLARTRQKAQGGRLPLDAWTLARVGQACFGRSWSGPMAQELDVSHRAIQRWANGEFEVPAAIWPKLRALCLRLEPLRSAELLEVARGLPE